MFSKINFFIPLTIVITGLSGLVYWAVQQDIRISSYDPQIQISEDIAAKLSQGADVSKLVPADTVEISKSLSPFVAVFDSNGKLVKSNARLNGKDIVVPKGVFDYTNINSQDRVSWQPTTGVRSAIIVTKFTNSKGVGYVVSGKSLREAEKRIDNLGFQVGLAWLVTMITTFVSCLIFIKNPKK